MLGDGIINILSHIGKGWKGNCKSHASFEIGTVDERAGQVKGLAMFQDYANWNLPKSRINNQLFLLKSKKQVI